MAKLLFRLRNVPEDEAEGIRALLAEHRFETFETSGGLFQISMPAIWLVHDSDFATARSVLDQWQAERLEAVRSQVSPTISLWQRLKQSPVRFTLLWLTIVVVASLSTWPFWQFFVRT